MLSGEVVLVTDGGEQVLGPGMCAGYAAGGRDAHHLINRSGKPAQYLEIGTRVDADQAFYPDDDLAWLGRVSGKPAPYALPTTIPAHKDGTPY